MSDNPFVTLSFGQVQVQIQVKPITAEGFQTYLSRESARIKQLLATRDQMAPRKAVVIVDGSVALMPPAAARKLQADWLRDNTGLLRVVTHRIGFVLPNPILRGFVSTVFYLAPLPVPTNVLGSLDEAVAWAIDEARSIGGMIDPELLSEGPAAVERARAAALQMSSACG